MKTKKLNIKVRDLTPRKDVKSGSIGGRPGGYSK
jgi:hypothetical protein